MESIELESRVVPGQMPEEEIDLRVYWNIIRKYKWSILGLTFLSGLLAVLVAFSLMPVYRATAVLHIEPNTSNIISIEEVYGLSSANREYYKTQRAILKSRNLAEKVVIKFKLASHAEFNPNAQARQRGLRLPSLNWREWLPDAWLPSKPPPSPPTAAEKRDTVVNAFMARLTVSQERDTQLMRISFEARDAKLAARVPNALIATYIENDREAKLKMTQEASVWLTERLANLRRKVEQSEKALQTYLEKENLVNVAGVKSVATKQIDEIAMNLVRARQQLSEARNAYNQVQALKGQSTKAFESIPAVLKHPLVQRMKEAEVIAEGKVSELKKRYGPKHPKMIAAKSELKSARANMQRQVKRVLESIKKEFDIAHSNVAALQSDMEANKVSIQQINRKEYGLGVLEREVAGNHQLYNMFLTRFKETDVAQSLHTTVGRVIDAAIVPRNPYKPKKRLIVMIALVLGLMFSVMLAFLLEYLDNTLKNVEDVEQKLAIPLLGVLPRLKNGKKNKSRAELIFLQENKSLFAESVRSIRTGVMFSNLDQPRKVLLVTSSIPAEGKTTFATNQAFALGQMEKTLLIDADMRRPSLARLFGWAVNAPGLSDLVAGAKEMTECIHPLEEAGIDVLPSGVVPPNPLELLSSQRFNALIEELGAKYEHIVIDSPPIQMVSDAVVLTRQATAVVYVVKAQQTPYQIVQDGIRQLQQVNAHILGIVLNHLSAKGVRYNYGGKYGYYGGYSYDDDASARA
ncbi:MAG: polysaccharide biosynthesis tyrosine autokinase [Gammaproteobacteria bacterium]|nr:polysaccharide biosynthesis tyrosine autokinase [Gammaproteobacteria bacterium]